MSLFHSWMQAAQHANLSKNEWRVFNTVVMQTVGYCKSSDAINSKQWSKLCPDLRGDRRNEAIQSLFDKRLIDVLEHDRFENEFFIPDHILAMGEIVCPSLPKNRKPVPEKEKATPEFQEELTLKTGAYRQKDSTKRITEKPTTTEPEAAVTPKADDCGGGLVFPSALSDKQQRVASQRLNGLALGDQQDCLNVLDAAIRDCRAKDPIAYLVGLVRKCRKGELTMPLAANPSPLAQVVKPSLAVERSNQLAEDAHLARLAQLGGVSVDVLRGVA